MKQIDNENAISKYKLIQLDFTTTPRRDVYHSNANRLLNLPPQRHNWLRLQASLSTVLSKLSVRLHPELHPSSDPHHTSAPSEKSIKWVNLPATRQSDWVAWIVIESSGSKFWRELGDPSTKSGTWIFIKEMQDGEEVIDANGNVGTLFFSDALHKLCRRFVIQR